MPIDPIIVDATDGTAPAGTAAEEQAAPTFSQTELDAQVEARVAAAREEFEASATPPAEEPAATPPAGGGGTDPATGGKLYTEKELQQHEKVAANRTMQKFADYGDLKKKVAEYETLVPQHTELKTEHETTKAERDTLQTQVARLEVALDKNLPKALAVRLKGLTREEIEADADELLKVAVPAAPAGGFGGGPAPTPNAPGSNFNDEIRRRAGYTSA